MNAFSKTFNCRSQTWLAMIHAVIRIFYRPQTRNCSYEDKTREWFLYALAEMRWVVSGRIGFLFFLIFIMFTFVSPPAGAAALDTSFDAQCPLLFSKANRFA